MQIEVDRMSSRINGQPLFAAGRKRQVWRFFSTPDAAHIKLEHRYILEELMPCLVESGADVALDYHVNGTASLCEQLYRRARRTNVDSLSSLRLLSGECDSRHCGQGCNSQDVADLMDEAAGADFVASAYVVFPGGERKFCDFYTAHERPSAAPLAFFLDYPLGPAGWHWDDAFPTQLSGRLCYADIRIVRVNFNLHGTRHSYLQSVEARGYASAAAEMLKCVGTVTR